MISSSIESQEVMLCYLYSNKYCDKSNTSKSSLKSVPRDDIIPLRYNSFLSRKGHGSKKSIDWTLARQLSGSNISLGFTVAMSCNLAETH